MVVRLLTTKRHPHTPSLEEAAADEIYRRWVERQMEGAIEAFSVVQVRPPIANFQAYLHPAGVSSLVGWSSLRVISHPALRLSRGCAEVGVRNAWRGGRAVAHQGERPQRSGGASQGERRQPILRRLCRGGLELHAREAPGTATQLQMQPQLRARRVERPAHRVQNS